jgi:hypothetical protein
MILHQNVWSGYKSFAFRMKTPAAIMTLNQKAAG